MVSTHILMFPKEVTGLDVDELAFVVSSTAQIDVDELLSADYPTRGYSHPVPFGERRGSLDHLGSPDRFASAPVWAAVLVAPSAEGWKERRFVGFSTLFG